MSRFRIKKQPLIAVAGIVWLLAGLNVVILGVRAAIDMRDVAAIVLIAIAGGAVAAFCGFHSMFSKLVKKNSQRIYELEGECHNPFRFFDRKGYIMMAIMMSMGIGMRAAGFFPEWFHRLLLHGPGLALTLLAPATSRAVCAVAPGRFTGPTERFTLSQPRPRQWTRPPAVYRSALLDSHAITASGGINLAVMLDDAGVAA